MIDDITWPIKHPVERVTAEFDFGPSLAAGDALASVELLVTTVQGVDAAPGALVYGVAQLKGARAYQALTGGLAGCSYRVECRATTTNNNLLLLARVLPVVLF
jgi:hypothetical protein